MIIAGITGVASARLDLGSFWNPGPGLFPFLLACTTGVLSLVLMAKEVTGKEKPDTVGQSITASRRGKKVIYVLAAIVAYGLLLEKLGYLFTTFLVFGLLLRVVESQRWSTVVIIAVATAVGSYILFSIALNIPLPRGLIGV
jgi:putative tricarboxylic transport membrane protein